MSGPVGNPLPFSHLPFFSRRSRAFRATAIALLFIALSAADIATRPDLSFLVFYILPVLLASWFLGPREGLLLSLASVGVWTLDDFLSHRTYSHPAIPIWNRGGELAFFVLLAWLVGVLRTALEREVRERTERLEADLLMAREVQTSLLPRRQQEIGQLSVAAECRQIFGVGGDIFEIQDLGAEGLFVAVADVSGKGMAAALLMSSFLASLRLLVPVHTNRFDTLAGELSERLRTSLETPRFVTAFLAIVKDGSVRYVNAGHNPGFLIAPGARPTDVVALHSTGTVLGLIPGARFEEKRVPFPPGSSLVLYTDGLTECANPAGQELGGERAAAVAAAAAGEAGASPASVVKALLGAAEAHAAGEPLGDDITVLCVRRRLEMPGA